jgi:ATP-dependent DNA ligase
VFAHACKIGLEGIVSARRDSPYRSGRSPDWLKSNTPRTYRDLKALAVEAAEHLKRKHPHSTVTVKDPQTGEATAVEYKPEARGR